MANRLFTPNPFLSLDNNLVAVFCRVTFGATSAVASQDGNGLVVSASAQGVFDCQLGTAASPDKYAGIMGVFFSPLCATASDTGWQIIEQTISTDGTFSIRNAPAGAAAHPLNGSSLYLMVLLRNSSTPRKGT
jgi:hypothetical protein